MLNAETLLNPYTFDRSKVVELIEKYGKTEYVKNGFVVHAIGRSKEAIETIEKIGGRAFWGSLGDIDSMKTAAAGCNLLIHCAASVSTFGSLKSSLESNVNGTHNAMLAAKLAGVRRAIHVGTEAATIGFEGRPIKMLTEDVPLPDKPFPGVYSISKNFAEKVALSYHSDDFIVVAVRPRLIWGNDDSVVLPAMVKAAQTGVLKWFDGGDYLTSTCHVFNVVEGIRLASLFGKGGKSYFLTDGDPVQFKRFVTQMLDAVDVQAPTASVPFLLLWGVAIVAETVCSILQCTPIVDRQQLVLVGQEVTVSDSLARLELGYKNIISMDEGLAGLKLLHGKISKEQSNKLEL